MYQIERKDGTVIIRRDGRLIYSDTEDSWVLFTKDKDTQATQIKNLKDRDLLLALAAMIELKAPDTA